MGSLGRVLIAAPVHLVLTDGLTGYGYTCVEYAGISQDIAFGIIKDCVGIVTSTRLQLDKELIDAAPLLKWIGRMGSGMEVIDIEYATLKGINCFASPEGNCNAVGEHALGMLLALIRRIAWSNAEMKKGIWLRDENRGTELEGKTIGIIGYGHTGRAFAKKLMGFDMQILVYDKYNQQNIPLYVENCESLERIYDEADIVSFHVPIQADTINYFNEDFVNQMRKPFILINTSRGVVVEIQALYQGVKEGKVRGACLDVFEQEPIMKMEHDMWKMMDEMNAMPNILTTPHIAGYTFEALYKMSKILFEKIAGIPLNNG